MNILLAFQSIRCPFLDAVFKIFTTLGEQYFIMLLFCWLAWCSDKRFAMKTGFAFCIGMGINQVLKIIFCVQRPWVSDSRLKPSDAAVKTATGYSFPSGHTQSGITVFGSLAIWIKKRFAAVLLIFCAVMTGVSRLYFGVHTPQDVCVSFAIGIAVILLIEIFYGAFERHPAPTAAVFIAISLCMVAFAILKPYPEYHKPEFMYDCIRIAGAIGGFTFGWFLEKKFLNYKTGGKTADKIARVAVGIVLLLILKLMFKKLFEQTYFIMYVQNFVLLFWCVFLYPFIFQKIRKI